MLKILLYPDDWQKITAYIKESVGYICQQCGKQCRRPGEMYLGWEYEMHIAHYDQDYDSPSIFVVAYCAVCHFRHDAPYVWHARRRHARLRGQLAGQLALAL